MSIPLLSLQNIALTFGGTALLEDASLIVRERDRICIIGRNGSGKSTLMKIAAGLVEADAGTRFLHPGSTLRYLPQEPDLRGHETVRAYVESGLAPGDDANRARFLLHELGLTGDENPAKLSGGEARRAAIARVLAPEPDILLLDEPTNHLDIDAIEWLEGALKSLRSALVLVSHDRRFLANLSQRTVWIDRGRTREIAMGFSTFEAWRDEALAQEEIEHHKLARKIEREADWLRYGVTARRKRNVRRLAALSALRDEHRTRRRVDGAAKIEAADAALSGKLVIEAKGVSKTFAGVPIVANFSTRIHRGDRVGIVGANGTGKSTLIGLLSGKIVPDAGSVRLGVNLEIASFEQGRDSLKPEWTVGEALTRGAGDTVMVAGRAKHVTAYMQDFLFAPEQVRTPVKVLSGGERARLMLARTLALPSNMLLLDEPTNDLDVETLDVLEEMLADYAGTVILISHDRDFLDRAVTSVIAPEGGGLWVEYAGGYTDMLAQRGEALAAKAVRKAEKAERSEAPIPAAQPKSKRRLSFNEKHALETLPGKIAQVTAEIATLRNRLSDPSFYSADPQGFEKATASLTRLEKELEDAENRWLELEILREELSN